jgi:hypothetical protein
VSGRAACPSGRGSANLSHGLKLGIRRFNSFPRRGDGRSPRSAQRVAIALPRPCARPSRVGFLLAGTLGRSACWQPRCPASKNLRHHTVVMTRWFARSTFVLRIAPLGRKPNPERRNARVALPPESSGSAANIHIDADIDQRRHISGADQFGQFFGQKRSHVTTWARPLRNGDAIL